MRAVGCRGGGEGCLLLDPATKTAPVDAGDHSGKGVEQEEPKAKSRGPWHDSAYLWHRSTEREVFRASDAVAKRLGD